MTLAALDAMADPTRRLLLERLGICGPISLSELAEGLPISRQAVTTHLERLRLGCYASSGAVASASISAT